MEEKEKRERQARIQFQRLQSRDRLFALAAQEVHKTPAEREIERLREYLKEWSHWTRMWQPNLGWMSSVPYLAQMRPTVPDSYGVPDDDCPDYLSTRWAMELLDSSIDDLAELRDGSLMRSALRVRWLNDGLCDGKARVRVFRGGRLAHLSLEEVDEIADRAEAALVPVVKRRGLPL